SRGFPLKPPNTTRLLGPENASSLRTVCVEHEANGRSPLSATHKAELERSRIARDGLHAERANAHLSWQIRQPALRSVVRSPRAGHQACSPAALPDRRYPLRQCRLVAKGRCRMQRIQSLSPAPLGCALARWPNGGSPARCWSLRGTRPGLTVG